MELEFRHRCIDLKKTGLRILDQVSPGKEGGLPVGFARGLGMSK